MKIKLLSGVALSAVATVLGPGAPVPAQAQSNNWTGFYVGLNAGGAWGRSDTVTDVACGGPNPYLCNSTGNGAENGTAVGAAGTGTIHPSSFTGGVQAGYNYEFNNIVVGLEIDFGAFKMKGSRQVSGTLPVNGPVLALAGTAYTVGTSIETHWLFTSRPAGRGAAVKSPGLCDRRAGTDAPDCRQ